MEIGVESHIVVVEVAYLYQSKFSNEILIKIRGKSAKLTRWCDDPLSHTKHFASHGLIQISQFDLKHFIDMLVNMSQGFRIG